MTFSKQAVDQKSNYSNQLGTVIYSLKSFVLIVLLSICSQSCKWNQSTTDSEAEFETKIKQSEPLQFSIGNNSDVTLDKTKFTNRFVLNRDTFLSAQFSLKQPLIESLRQLGPGLTDVALLRQGNFQFSILVDDQIVYVENLNTGAGLVTSKTKKLNHRIPLITPEPIDYWGWFMWLKFMKMAGGRDLLDHGNHTLRIEVRSYLQEKELIVGPLLASGSLDVEVAEIPFDANEAQLGVQKIQKNSGWKHSTDAFDVSKIEALNKKIAQKRFEQLKGIVVVKEGKLLIEEYFNGSGRDSLHDPRSVGKTIASTMLGIAIDEGYIVNEMQTLTDFYDLKSYTNYSSAKDSISVKSLLTMSSGFLGNDNDFSSPGNEENMYPTKDWVKFALDLPLDSTKVMGIDYSYFTGGAVILGDIIHKSAPDGLVTYADKKLFSPLGITNYKWQYTPQNVGNTAGGIRLRAIDFAKYGQLYKNNGRWEGTQILSESWVKKSLSKHVKQPDQLNGFYGYLFWNKVYSVEGREYEVSFCTGNGGNKIFIFKDIPFVVVITSAAYNLPYAHTDVDTMMTEYILPAVLNE